MAASLQAVREAALDGRMHNVVTRRTQLEALQQTLLDNTDTIQDAICADTGYVAPEAAAEYLLTLNTLKEYHQSLDIDRALQDEYAIARGEDAASRRDPVGIVYIVPTSYTVFYSVLVAVAGALTAGNCIVIELPNSLRALPVLIKKLLESSLDRSIIAFVPTPAKDEDLGPQHMRLQQDDHLPGKVVAVVDRTANINKAAEALVAAGFSFGGQSPYAPDLVLVNEYIKEPFLMALVQASVSFSPSASAIEGDDSRSEKTDQDEKGGLRVVSSLGRGKIMEADQLDPEALPDKTTSGRLLVHTVRSLDHAIDLSNLVGSLQASYVFAHEKSAKYLTQFINARVSFVNHIPVEVLVGPSAPEQVAFDRSMRYPTTFFSVPRPHFISPTRLSQSVTDILRAKSSSALQSTLVLRSRELVSRTQRPLGGGVGFFEQGILTGLGLFSISMLAGVSALGYWTWSIVARHGSRV
ncbi:PutA family dehydrogenase, putative [Penicillium digitatum]|uniref:PutA family dehydrogenase, putative n=3 Tax=Penicillium digitatum TaxID=36651 RepID=K9G5B5_PEND2|nr:PutA family dehydrogenase, putative [Penicillium digitatum Pd1]EKV04280.1 PutA family dehydrogenase, putative [Penicillium digitatum Pd1]EKV17150.1 PutA family dehydrogenase, putative [Penicillium digitatum PHI26]QQK39808.1 PutA family dehydrogenase, putative [Penicillium digitatum]